MIKREVRRGGIVVLTLAFAGGVGVASWRWAPTARSAERAASRASTRSEVAAQVVFKPANGATGVRLDQPVQVGAVNGRIISAELRDQAGTIVAGSVVSGGSLWYATPGTLKPAVRYDVVVRFVDGDARVQTLVSSFATVQPRARLSWEMTPGDGDVVGVGMPVIVKFRQPVLDKQAVEQRLEVQTSRNVTGAWHWFSDREVHFRPESYWPANTTVAVIANLAGVDAGNGVWATDSHSTAFSIGDAHISTADANAHTVTVTNNGRVVNLFPASLGREKYPTMSGSHVVLAKQQSVVMDSATTGIPRDSPDGYYETVLWNVAITEHGEYVHAAPWSVSQQGRVNVSHGCVNLSPERATWFFNFSQRGDIVNVVGTGRPPEFTDTAMKDWNLPWSTWLAGSALPRTSRLAPGARLI